MLQQPDGKFRAAANDDNAARNLLNDLHQQVLMCRDSVLLAPLLGQYVAIATARCQTSSAGEQQSVQQAFQLLSRMLKDLHDTAKAVIQNLRT